MTTPSLAMIAAKVQRQRKEIVDAWIGVVEDVCRPPLSQDELRANLQSLFERIITSLCLDPFDPSEARSIGHAVAQICSSSEMLGATQVLLTGRFQAHLVTAEQSVLQPVLAAFMGYAALGFAEEVHEERSEEEPHRQRRAPIDVIAGRLAEDELSKAHRLIAQAREAERLRLAQELHDGAVQQLLGLSYQLADMQRRAGERHPWSPVQRLEELAPGLEMVRNDMIAVAQDLRRLISFLRPPTLRELGLSHVLDAYVSDWQQKLGPDAPHVALDIACIEDEPVPESVAICLFRLVQECLWNAHKHASASRVTVCMHCQDRAILLRIRDDGCGFHIPPHLFQFAASGRFGFAGMEERVHALDGFLSVWSEPGQGTEIQACIPL